VQEVVDRDGWAPGNDLVLLISGDGVRRAESHDGILAAAPLLHVEYAGTPGGGGSTFGCGVGPELLLGLPALAWLRRRQRAARSR